MLACEMAQLGRSSGSFCHFTSVSFCLLSSLRVYAAGAEKSGGKSVNVLLRLKPAKPFALFGAPGELRSNRIFPVALAGIVFPLEFASCFV